MTDEGVRHLATCAHLKSLDLSHCWKVTDGGVSRLPALALLAHLDIAYCWQVGCLVWLAPCMRRRRARSPQARYGSQELACQGATEIAPCLA